jgi:uncharacterized membrane protein
MNRTIWIAFALALTTATTLAQSQTAPEPQTTGDIPDNQAFVRYTNAAGGYSLEIPEGWARTVQGANTRFEAKLNSVSVSVLSATIAPTAASEKTRLEKDTGVKVRLVQDLKLPAGKAVLVRFDSQSKPNEVTGQRVPLENDVYVFFNKGREVQVTMGAPKGADNVDAWNRVARSFTWR